MNKRQTEVEKAKLAAEARELKELKAMYKDAADQIAENIKITDGKIEVMLQDWDNLSADDKSVYQSKIYQRIFQKQLQKQVNDSLKGLKEGQYKSIDEYLKRCYETGFIGSMYDIAGQGIPLILPIDQKKVIKAIRTNSKIKGSLYEALGEDVDSLRKRISNSISRGIATADSYKNIARNIANDSNVGFNNAMRIARTEGHRIHSNSAFDAQLEAKAAGADIVKQWDSTMDGKTRTHHRLLDGQIREVEEPFEMGGMKPMYPADFGRPEEDINCRCVLLQRATWALDDDELEVLREKARFHGALVDDSKAHGHEKAKDFAVFKKRYLKTTKDNSIMNLYLKNINKKVGDEAASAFSSFASLPEKVKKRFEKVTFDFGYVASACDYKNRTIRVGANATKDNIDHEFGHLIEYELMGIKDVIAYKKYLVEGLNAKDICKEIYRDNNNNPVTVYILKGDRFISEYQGRLYIDDPKQAINKDGTININYLKETISETFRLYCENQLKDKKAFEIIERAVK